MSMITLWYIILALGISLSIIRALLGPTAPDRAASVDIMTTAASGLLIIIALARNNALLLDVSLVYSILSFIAVIAVARYLEKGV